jgi:hypothetical protein
MIVVVVHLKQDNHILHLVVVKDRNLGVLDAKKKTVFYFVF